MKVRLDDQEWYPVYTLDETGYGFEADLPVSLVRRLRRLVADFNKVQNQVKKRVIKV